MNVGLTDDQRREVAREVAEEWTEKNVKPSMDLVHALAVLCSERGVEVDSISLRGDTISIKLRGGPGDTNGR